MSEVLKVGVIEDFMPANPRSESGGHVLRIDGELDIYTWNPDRGWYEDSRGRWIHPADMLTDGDEYLGQLMKAGEIEALRAALHAEKVTSHERMVDRSILRGAVTQAAQQFEFYEEQHRAKGTPEADAKADVNKDLAARMRAALNITEGADGNLGA